MDLNALIRELERRGEFARTLTHEQLAESTDSLVLVDAPAEEVLCPQQPQPDQPILLGTPPPSLQQPFLPAPGLDAAPGPSRYLPPTVQHPGLWSNQAAHCSKPQVGYQLLHLSGLGWFRWQTYDCVFFYESMVSDHVCASLRSL